LFQRSVVSAGFADVQNLVVEAAVRLDGLHGRLELALRAVR